MRRPDSWPAQPRIWVALGLRPVSTDRWCCRSSGWTRSPTASRRWHRVPGRPHLYSRTSESNNSRKPAAASHLHRGYSYSSGAGDHDGFGSTTGTLGAHRRVLRRHPFGGAAVGGLYRHETCPVYEPAPALGTQQVDTDSFAPRWSCHAWPFALSYDSRVFGMCRPYPRIAESNNSRKPRARECVKGTGEPVPLPTESDLRLAP